MEHSCPTAAIKPTESYAHSCRCRATQGCEPLLCADAPFFWSTDLDLGRGMWDWKACGAALFYFVATQCQCPGERTNLIVHSHGLQGALYAAAGAWFEGVQALKINTLISIGSPIRADMTAVAEAARPNIGRWIHIHGGRRDRWQWLGELLDGHWGIVREARWKRKGRVVVEADDQVFVPKASHTDVLERPSKFPLLWQEWLSPAEAA